MTKMTSIKILSRMSQHRQTQDDKMCGNVESSSVCPLQSCVCISRSRAPLRHGRPVIESVMDGDQKMLPRLSWNGIVPLHHLFHPGRPPPSLQYIPNLDMTNNPLRLLERLEESWHVWINRKCNTHSVFTSGKGRYQVTSCFLSAHFWEIFGDAALISSRIYKVWEGEEHQRLADAPHILSVIGRRVFKKWTHEAEVFVFRVVVSSAGSVCVCVCVGGVSVCMCVCCVCVDTVHQIKAGLCFWLSAWEVKPHLPRILCHALPLSPLRCCTRLQTRRGALYSCVANLV